MKRLINLIHRIFLSAVMLISRVIPVRNNKIVFSSYRGRQMSDNPLFIFREIGKRDDLDIDIVWLLNDNVDLPAGENIRAVKYDSLKSAYELATAKVWVDNCRKRPWVKKRKGQFYLQTWHGNIAGKKVEADAENLLNKSYVRLAKHDSTLVDLFISGSKWATDCYRRAFWYDGEIWESGLPRSDIFYRSSDEYSKKVRAFYELNDSKHIAIYAPTFRGDHRLICYDMDYHAVIKTLESVFGGDWVLLVRLHPNISNMSDLICYDDTVLNGLLYQDINEIIVASEVLITDYSSCMFDAMEAGKKVFLYASDIEEYDAERGRYFAFSDLPFSLGETNEELIKNIKNFNLDKYNASVLKFMSDCGFCNNVESARLISSRLISVMFES